MAVPSGFLAAAISMAVMRFSFPSVRKVPIGELGTCEDDRLFYEIFEHET